MPMDTAIATPARSRAEQPAMAITTWSPPVLSRLNLLCLLPTTCNRRVRRGLPEASKRIFAQSLKWLSSMGSVCIRKRLKIEGKRKRMNSKIRRLNRKLTLGYSALWDLEETFLSKTFFKRTLTTWFTSRVSWSSTQSPWIKQFSTRSKKMEKMSRKANQRRRCCSVLSEQKMDQSTFMTLCFYRK